MTPEEIADDLALIIVDQTLGYAIEFSSNQSSHRQSYRLVAEKILAALREAADTALAAQLPEGMKDCTILHKVCGKGHSWLTATNWVDHGCPFCAIESARVEAVRARKERRTSRKSHDDPSLLEEEVRTVKAFLEGSGR